MQFLPAAPGAVKKMLLAIMVMRAVGSIRAIQLAAIDGDDDDAIVDDDDDDDSQQAPRLKDVSPGGFGFCFCWGFFAVVVALAKPP